MVSKWLNIFVLLELIDGRCSYREACFPSSAQRGVGLLQSLIGQEIKPSTLFICSLKLSVDTEKLMFQKAALNRPGIPELWIILTWSLQCLAWGPRVLYRKALVCLEVSLATVNDYFKNFLFLDCRTYFLGGLNLKSGLNYRVQFFCSCLSTLMWWPHLAGVVQRNQPCLHGHPLIWIVHKILFTVTT